jgi:hypothetical protein
MCTKIMQRVLTDEHFALTVECYKKIDQNSWRHDPELNP